MDNILFLHTLTHANNSNKHKQMQTNYIKL